jgi:hypothetical protein
VDWSAIMDAVFLAGAAASAAFLVYGGWLCRYQYGSALPVQTADGASNKGVPIEARLSELSSSAALPLLAIVITLAAGISTSLA